jgi:hypothetical protein
MVLCCACTRVDFVSGLADWRVWFGVSGCLRGSIRWHCDCAGLIWCSFMLSARLVRCHCRQLLLTPRDSESQLVGPESRLFSYGFAFSRGKFSLERLVLLVVPFWYAPDLQWSSTPTLRSQRRGPDRVWVNLRLCWWDVLCNPRDYQCFMSLCSNPSLLGAFFFVCV